MQLHLDEPPIPSKLIITDIHTEFSISIFFCQSAQMSLKIFVKIMEDTVTTKETLGV